MSDIFIRFRTSGGIDKKALTLLAEHGTARVSNTTKVIDGELRIHSQTALAFAAAGYVEKTEDGIAITDDGRDRAAQFNESRAERKRRKMREDLAAQASGKWKPTPAGYSATAQSAEAEARHDIADARYHVAVAHDRINHAKRMIRLAKEWGKPSEVEDWEAELADAEADLERKIQTRDMLIRTHEKRTEEQRRAA
jgi:hypothetical protein